MKKIRKYGIILFAGLCACAAWSCEEDKTDRKFTPKDPVIKLGGDVEVGKAGGSYTVPIESNLPWRVRSEADAINLNRILPILILFYLYINILQIFFINCEVWKFSKIRPMYDKCMTKMITFAADKTY